MDRWMKRLEPAVQQLRKTGDLPDIEHRHIAGSKRGRRTSGRDDVPTQPHQVAGKGDHPTLVTHGY
jgi:hypothetical protein